MKFTSILTRFNVVIFFTHFFQIGPPRLEEDEDLGEPEGLSPQKMEEMKADQEAKTHAQLLTLIGDLPDADIKPPDNVLFVCKLNPVTTSEDLEVIFSRFGEIKSCEVIRDRRTNASLQYAFIEFEREEDCENAFFKMDKVVIDDRRIHVDFSQSVAKEWRRYREGGPQPSKDFPPRENRYVNRPTNKRETYHSKTSHSHRRSPEYSRPDDRRKRYSESREAKRKPRSRSPSEKKKTEFHQDEKFQPLFGADLDVVVSDEETESSSSSSRSNSRDDKRSRKRYRSKHFYLD